MAKRNQPSAPKTNPIEWGDVRAERVAYESGATIFQPRRPGTTIIYIENGSVRLSVVSHAGKEAVIAVLDGGDFFGEGCLAGQSVRTATATAISECSVMRIRRQEIARKLHAEESFADFFVSHILKRNIRMEEDLIDQLFNSTEKRLARTLLLLAQYGKSDGPRRALPKVSQEILAEMVGTTRPACQLLHEQVQEARVHRVRRERCEGEQLAPRSRPGRLTRPARDNHL